jgi:hypothetical protein
MEYNMSNTTTNSPETQQNASLSKKLAPNDHALAIIHLFAPDERYESSDRSSVSFLSKLVLEIAVLTDKIEHPEHQELYFRLGIEANKARLKSLQQQFDTLRQEVNTANTDVLREEIESIEEFLMWYDKNTYLGFIKELVIHSKSSRKRHLELVLGIKNAVGVINELIYYLKI